MTILANSISLSRYRVETSLPLFPSTFSAEPAIEALKKFGFRSIMEEVAEVSTGFVQINDQDSALFDNLGYVWIGDYLFFSLRRDVRVIPSIILNSELKKVTDEWLADHPNFRRPPKIVREEMKEAVKQKLLSRQLPDSQVWDVIWDTKGSMIYFFNTSTKAMEVFASLFRKAFPDFSLVYLTPWHQAEVAAIPFGIAYDLKEMNHANTNSVLDLIKSNSWLGKDFLLWILSGQGNTACEGLTAWVDNRIDMAGLSREGGIEKVTVAGSQEDSMPTVKAALSAGHYVTKSAIYLQDTDDNQWSLVLTGETFAISQMRTPPVIVEPCEDAQAEYQGALLEKLSLIDKGLSHLQQLFGTFLEYRVNRWDEEKRAINNWLED